MLHDIRQVGSQDEFDLDPTYQYGLAHAFETMCERKISEGDSECEGGDEGAIGKEIRSEGGDELESEGGGELGSEGGRETRSESEDRSEGGGENDAEDSGGDKSREDIERKRTRLKETPEEGEVSDSSDTDSEVSK